MQGPAVVKAALYTGWAFPDAALAPLARAARLDQAPAEEASILVGWSLGGLRAMRDALHRSPGPIGLVLLSSGARFCSDQHGWPGIAPAALRALHKKLRSDPLDALRGFHRLTAGPEAPDRLIEERCRTSAGMDLAAGLDELATLDWSGALCRLAMPVLLLHGARDKVFFPEAAEATARQLPRATLKIHPEAGHDLPLTHTEWCAEQLAAWLDSIA